MTDRTKEVGIRLSVKDADIAKAALAQFGSDGAAALKRIEAAGTPASTSLLALSGAIDASKEKGTDFFKAMALSSLGGVAAFIGIEGAIEGVRSSLEKLSSIKDAAEAAGLDPEFLQSVARQAELVGVKFDETSQALAGFNKNSGDAANGIGRMYSQLKTLDPELLKQIQTATSQEERVKLVADAIQNQTDVSKAAAIATAAFGNEVGSKLVGVLKQGKDGIDANTASLKAMGQIIGDDVVDQGAELNNQFTAISETLENKFTVILVKLGPLLTSTASLLATIAGWVSQTVDAFTGLSLDDMRQQLGTLDKLIAEAKTPGTIQSMIYGGNGLDGTSRLGALQAQRDALASTMATFEKDHPAPTPPKTGTGGGISDPQAEKKIDAVNKSLDLQIKNLGETNRQQEINNELSKAGTTIDTAAGKAIAAKAGQFYDEKQAIDEANQAAGFLAQTTESAFESVVDGSESVTDAIGDITKALEAAVLQAALLGTGPLGNIFGGAPTTSGGTGGILGSLLSGFGLGTNAKGAVYTSADLSAYSNSVVDRPTLFRFAKGGVMGEAGPEAIMPLTRGADGKLGVYAGGGGQVVNNFNVVNQSGASVQTSKRQNASGGIDFEAVITDLVASKIAKPGNSINRALRVGMGNRQQLTRRGS